MKSPLTLIGSGKRGLIQTCVLIAISFAALESAQAQPDPSDVIEYGYYCTYNYIWNGTRAKIYHPTTPQGCSTAVYSPLVVLLHGYGYAYTDYNYLLRHLARNGFIAVSIDVLGVNANSHAAAVAAAKAFMKDFLWTTWSKRFFIDPDNVAIIGHSRGTGTAVELAADLATPGAGDPPWQVKAIVELAPVAHNLEADGSITIGHMLLHGTKDDDTSPLISFGHYDNSGSDDSQQDPAWSPDVTYRAMKIMEDANHKGFSEQGSVDQQEVTKGYVLSFLAAHLKNDTTWYDDYVRGDWVPHGWAGAIVTQYSDGFLRRVIDHFEDGVVAGSAIGGSVGVNLANTSVVDLSTLNYSPHKTQALQVLPTSINGYVQWSIPVGKRNENPFRWLSLRIGQTSGTPTTDMTVQIRNGLTWSAEVPLADYGDIAQRLDMCTVSGVLGCQSLDSMAHMGTIRIPLTAFGARDDVQYVRLRFRGNSLIHNFHIDNVEFSEWIFKP